MRTKPKMKTPQNEKNRPRKLFTNLNPFIYLYTLFKLFIYNLTTKLISSIIYLQNFYLKKEVEFTQKNIYKPTPKKNQLRYIYTESKKSEEKQEDKKHTFIHQF